MWVKLHDSWLDWEWADNPDMVALFFRLLTMAAKFDGNYHGRAIKRGQCIVCRRTLSEKSGISEQTVRTCLARLEQTGEIVREVTNKFTIVTICNYNIYQANQVNTNQQLTNEQPTTNQQLTTLIDNKNKEDNLCCDDARARLEESTILNALWLNQTSMSLHHADVMGLAVDVMNEWEITQLPEEEWTAQHLFNHMRKKLYITKSQSRPTKQDEKEARRAELKQAIINDLNLMRNGYTTEPKN